MAHIGSSSESSSPHDKASSYVQQQTGSKRAGQVPGPKAAAKKQKKKQQIFVDSWLQHSAFKTWLCKKVHLVVTVNRSLGARPVIKNLTTRKQVLTAT